MEDTATAGQKGGRREPTKIEERSQVRERFSGGVGIYSSRLPPGTSGLQDVAVRSGLVGWNDRPRLLRSVNFQRKTKRVRTSK